MNHDQFQALRLDLNKRFPLAFPKKAKARRPLAVGIHEQVKDAMGWPQKQTRDFLYWWCNRPKYLAAVMSQEVRINLDGTVAGDVHEQDRTWCQKKMARKIERRLTKGKALPNPSGGLPEVLASFPDNAPKVVQESDT